MLRARTHVDKNKRSIQPYQNSDPCGVSLQQGASPCATAVDLNQAGSTVAVSRSFLAADQRQTPPRQIRGARVRLTALEVLWTLTSAAHKQQRYLTPPIESLPHRTRHLLYTSKVINLMNGIHSCLYKTVFVKTSPHCDSPLKR